jgi:hypothetical protein
VDGSALVVVVSGLALASSSPRGLAQHVGQVHGRLNDQNGEQVANPGHDQVEGGGIGGAGPAA